MRVPFEIVSIEADRILMRMALSPNNSNYYWNIYCDYINACGWEHDDLDREILFRIDSNWDNKLNIN